MPGPFLPIVRKAVASLSPGDLLLYSDIQLQYLKEILIIFNR